METQHARDDDYMPTYAGTLAHSRSRLRMLSSARSPLDAAACRGASNQGRPWQGRAGRGLATWRKRNINTYAHEKRINALNLEPLSKLIDLPRRRRKMKDPLPRGAATTRDFRAALEEIDRKMKGMVISRSVEALGRAIDEEQKTEQRMLRPGTGSAAPSTEHKTEGQYVGVRGDGFLR